jgi:hypothetical protein
MISDLTEKTEPPPPLTQREMSQFVTLSTLPTLERALDRLRWLEAELAALKANGPLAEMWAALEEYQPMADAYGHGESWRTMCRERTTLAAWAAASAAEAAAAEAAWDAARGAGYAARDAAFSAQHADIAIATIRRAKEAR